MGKTSIQILEETLANSAVAVGGGEIATVLGGAVRGKIGKVHTLASSTDLLRIFGSSKGADYKYCAYLLNRGNILKVVRAAVTNVGSPAKASALAPFGATGNDGLKFTAVEYGQAYNGLKVVIRNLGGDAEENLFSIEILSADNELLEGFGMVSLDPDSEYYFGKVVASDIVELSIEGTWTNQTLFDTTANPPVNVQNLTLAGATETTEPASLVTTLAPLEDLEVAFATLILPTRTPSQVATDVVDLFKARNDFELLIDPDASMSADAALTTLGTVTKSNATAFFPRLALPSLVDCAPSVCMADLIANLHKRKLWYKAPAGLEFGLLANVSNVKLQLTKKQVGDLQEAHINPIIVKTGNGVVAWGNSTLAKSPADVQDLAVRLLVNYLKRTVYRLSQRFIFADHNEFTWNQWKNSVEPVVRDIYNVKGINDYRVTCDRSTMSAEDIDNGIMRGEIAIWPISHIERIVIKFGIDKSGVTFE